ncbi:acetylornithine deacetylase [Rhodobacteraceae bacterium 2376]|uniref:Acetylornithine deacetylase n=1 Tax=Rhabdonatronobacter sediminivivens TaxID=2743469 RepID=A0A7Z0I0Q8_9RHOB|nr:acetylornithine deacetylase [Rhabdonatronobacter sediminivivens]NYS25782.1 acetylornithine deacetylase [Rhabdonatronobacter sediminivivens]
MPQTLSARDILDRLVAFPSVSRDSNLPLIDWVEGYLAEHGIGATRVPSPCGTKAHLFAQVGPDVPGGLILSGHTDVVPVDGQDWTTDPWQVTERDGRLYGRGTCDMKGFVALAIAAMVQARGMDLSRPLQLALSYDEEVGCMAVVDLIHAMVDTLPRAEAVIVGEPTTLRVVTGHKGGTGYRVHMRGFEVHSSILHRGVSAVMEAARLIQWANERNAENARATPGPLAAAFDPPWTTLHVGTIAGGTAHNITARDCHFSLSFRVVPGDDPETWCAAFEAEVARIEADMKAIRPEAAIHLDRYFALPPLRPERGGRAEERTRRLSGDNGSHVVSYGTEGGQFQAQGYSTVVCGPGDIAQAHQPDEFIEIDQFKAGAAFLDRLLAEMTA